MNTAAAVDVEKKYVKCRITLVNPGSSDSVIDVFPAEVSEEKIWLDNTPGIERWQVVQRILDNYAEKGTRVPKPAKWHNDGKFNKPDLNEEDIPLVRLDGAILKALPKPEVVPLTPAINQRDVDARFNALNQKFDALVTMVTSLQSTLTAKVPVTETVTKCDQCQFTGVNKSTLKSHKTKMHKS